MAAIDPPRALPWRGYLCLALSMSLVGSYVALSKSLVASIPVLLLAWLRFGIGGLAMLGWLKKPLAEAPLDWPLKKLVFLESFLGNFLFTLCMLYGVSLTSAVSAGIIMATLPAMVALLSWLFLRERISVKVWLAIACAALAMALFSWSRSSLGDGPSQAAYGQPWLGNLLVFAAVLCEASYAVIGKKLSGALSPKRITALINLWGLLLMTPLGFFSALVFDFASVRIDAWLLLLFYSLAASIWTVWLWMTGLKTVAAAKAGVFTVMLPVTAALVGVLVLGEKLAALQWLAFGIALAGVVLATSPENATLRDWRNKNNISE